MIPFPSLGYKLVSPDNPSLPDFYQNKQHNWFSLSENEYLVIADENGAALEKYKWQDGKHKPVYKKTIESQALGKIRPKNIQQEFAIDLLLDDSIPVKLISGGFGSGKTMLSSACAFQLLQEGKYDRIMWIRNNIEVKDSNPIGHLKGDYYEKMSVWAMPLADHIGGRDMLENYIQRGKIEIEHLGFLRGRDIKNTIIFVSEAEHLTREHVQLLLGRVAENSILILEGDCRQIDRKVFESNNGMIAAAERLRGNRLFSCVYLTESVRSDTAKLADLLDD